MQLSLRRKFRAAEIIVMEVGLPVDYLLTRTSQADVEVEESTWYFRGGVACAKVQFIDLDDPFTSCTGRSSVVGAVMGL
jgi:hypothetical protein